MLYTDPFFYPDCTVGPGVAPGLRLRAEIAIQALVGCTTGRE